MLKPPLKVRLAAFIASLWVKSLRIRLSTPNDFSPGILGAWHKDLLAATAAFKKWGVHAFISESSDGNLYAMVAEKLGYTVTRGSSSHGASNVRHLLKSLKAGKFVGMALDGPHGPALEIKQGSIWLSQSSGRPLWCLEVKYGPHFTLKTWDNFILPLPLTAIDIQIKYFCTQAPTMVN